MPGRYSGTTVLLPFEDIYTRDNGKSQIEQEQKRPAGVAIKLDALVDQQDSLSEAWSFFLKNYPRKDCQALINPAYQDLRHLQHGDVFKKLLRSLAAAWAVKPDGLPRPSQVMEKLMALGIWRPDFWDHAAWPVARRLFFLLHQKPEGSDAAAIEPIGELLDWWSMFIARHAHHAHRAHHATPIADTGGIGSIDWPAIHARATDNKDTPIRGFEFETRLYGFFKGLAPEAKRRLSSLTLVSVDILSKDAVTDSLPTARKADCAGILKTLLLLVKGRNVSRPAESLRHILGTFDGAMSPVAMEDYVRHVQQLPDRAHAMIVAVDARSTGTPNDDEVPTNEVEQLDPEEQKQRLFSTHIQRAQVQQNSMRLLQTWNNLKASYSSLESGQEKIAIPARLYDQLIAAFFAVRKGDTALEVWKFMVTNGTQPTTKTWTAMMDGANKAKDWDASDAVWHRMLDSGVVLDETAWVVRLTMLARSGRFHEGFATLEDFGRRWIAASSTSDPHSQALQPTMTIVNSVIHPLARKSRKQDLARVLEWARGFGLQPNTRTYNALLSAAVGRGDNIESRQLLQQMSDQGIEPDDATYSIILDDILVNSLVKQSLTPEQVQDKAFEALENLEKQGMKANNTIYGQLIDRLLKRHGNLPAAEAVVSYMFKQGVEPSEHAYTSLVTHYFSLDPPDVASVNDILERLLQGKHRNVNSYFYDRVLEGFAKADNIQLAMRTLRQMRKESRKPSWQALLEIVLALERAEEFKLMADLVADLETREMIGPSRTGYGRDMRGMFLRTMGRLRAEGKIAPRVSLRSTYGIGSN